MTPEDRKVPEKAISWSHPAIILTFPGIRVPVSWQKNLRMREISVRDTQGQGLWGPLSSPLQGCTLSLAQWKPQEGFSPRISLCGWRGGVRPMLEGRGGLKGSCSGVHLCDNGQVWKILYILCVRPPACIVTSPLATCYHLCSCESPAQAALATPSLICECNWMAACLVQPSLWKLERPEQATVESKRPWCWKTSMSPESRGKQHMYMKIPEDQGSDTAWLPVPP